MKRIKIKFYVIGLLSNFLVFGIVTSYQAQAVWTKTETSRIQLLEKKIQTLEAQIASKTSQERTIKFLAIRGNVRVCPGDSYPILDFPFNPGEGYKVPARMSDSGNFNQTIELIYCAVDINEQK